MFARLSGRLSCVSCKATFHSVFPQLQPKVDMICDHCHSPLQRRSDAKQVEIRIQEFQAKTAPAITLLEENQIPVVRINGIGSPSTVFERIQKVLQTRKNESTEAQ